MAAHARVRGRVLRAEYLFALAVLVMLVLMSRPSFRAFAAPDAHLAQRALITRIDDVRQRARRENRLYSIVFSPPTGMVSVIRWTPHPDKATQRAETVATLSDPLLARAVVEMTTLPNDVLLINRTGFPLSHGRIYLKAADGSHDSVETGK